MSGDRESFQGFTGKNKLILDHCCPVHCGSPVPKQNKQKYCQKKSNFEKRDILNEIKLFAKPRDKAGEIKLVWG